MLFYGKQIVMSREKALIGIRLAGLSEGTHEFEFNCMAADFRDPALLAAGFSQGVLVWVTVEKMEGEMIVTMKTRATADLTCDLCLAPLSSGLHGSYRIYYRYEQTNEAGQEHDEDCRIIDRNTQVLDLTEDVRETLLLSVPMKVACTDNPDCRVLHQEKSGEPGEDRKLDSDWQESLEKLKNKYC
ncbi:MAG TPA: DUF177 domain-containing protein [Chlorobaculum parvum]|uniref:DUF177 domain-containing protein n=1 Tax=Chlorobaculum parvum TaxID=274539 RepID=A0A7C5HA02_9CHLB|nr:DUF177 domain-containing protein [Chlorobaculum parvum]